MARSGLGVALLADRLVAEDLKEERLVELLSKYETPPAPVYALTPQGRHATSEVRALIEHLAAAFAKPLPSRRRVATPPGTSRKEGQTERRAPRD